MKTAKTKKYDIDEIERLPIPDNSCCRNTSLMRSWATIN